ncbi:Na+-transporting NADH:ubiquinone oxidoreductase subunit A [Desulfuromusa kysingii]|uniref:Na(+)-translocating NADH-quinone reductase subunit A n=1 Tax=Desulfuromusa kysingii TaxID=37625 RepID=A0A1H4E1L3_9BACT|nr:Na(+)-translocating NADH-quinone reductase subunit A [Desulfuromusa kysingii]SEA78282.1 Na+-transporting NADH:ubiquinone oxidoreductase subunit A [Desulfuromusa kysingii]
MIKISKGLDLPITGSPEQTISDGLTAKTVAVLGPDYVGMKPSMCVKVGDQVKLGQLLFTDKKTAGVKYTAPGCGEVIAINRGERRALQSVVIRLNGTDAETFDSFSTAELETLSREKVVSNLVDSGLWTALRTRPFNKVPAPDSVPHSIFVTAMDTNPLAANAELVIKGEEQAFSNGLKILTRLTEGKVFVCQKPDAALPAVNGTTKEEFDGPHPAGLAGTHIHFLDPVNETKTVWSINYQDVIAYGQLFVSGKLPVDRVIALGGPGVKTPRLLRTRVGVSLEELLAGELDSGEQRIISGSVLNGTTAAGPLAFLGRYHLQVSVLPEKRDREFCASLTAGADKYSIKRAFLSAFTGGPSAPMNTSQYGSKENVLAIGSFEKVLPIDTLPNFLLRSLAAGDTDQAQDLGCLELAEEDLALCTYVCAGKNDYGIMLRDALTIIEKEG